MSMELIPGLTDDLARECLIRVPFRSFASLLSVSKGWNREIRNPDFHRYRKLAGLTRPVFVMTQYLRNDPVELGTLSNWIVLFDPEPGLWTQLPSRPPVLHSQSISVAVARVGVNKILTISYGWDTSGKDFQCFNFVHVFDFLTGQWCRAADMPRPIRAYFGLASDPIGGKVVVAGGHCMARPIRSAMMYDVGTDEWVRLGDMEKERGKCSAVFHGGKFHVIGGYNSFPSSDEFMTCAESLDHETWQWGPVERGFLEEGGYCRVVENGEGDLYNVGSRDVAVRRGGLMEWQAMTRVPKELTERSGGVVTWKDKMVVWGEHPYRNESFYYLLDLNSSECTNLDLPEEYSTRVLVKGCGLDL